MSGLFYECSSLQWLPEISKLNLNNLKKLDNIFKGCSSLLSFPNIAKWNLLNINDKNNLNNFREESLSNKNSSSLENTNVIDSDNINSSSFLNNQDNTDLNLINEYKIEEIDFSFKDNSLDLYYNNFYS